MQEGLEDTVENDDGDSRDAKVAGYDSFEERQVMVQAPPVVQEEPEEGEVIDDDTEVIYPVSTEGGVGSAETTKTEGSDGGEKDNSETNEVRQDTAECKDNENNCSETNAGEVISESEPATVDSNTVEQDEDGGDFHMEKEAVIEVNVDEIKELKGIIEGSGLNSPKGKKEETENVHSEAGEELEAGIEESSSDSDDAPVEMSSNELEVTAGTSSGPRRIVKPPSIAPALTKNQMELLELEMRARAIKAMLKNAK